MTMRPSARIATNIAIKLLVPSGRSSSILTVGAGADDVLQRLREQSKHLDSRTYVKLFQRCMELRDPSLGKQVRDHIIQTGRQLNIYELNTLMKLYALCGSVEDARHVFDSIVDKTVVSWNAIIAGYAQLGHAKEAFTLFRQMLQERLEPNTITYLTVLDACSSPEALKWGKQVHAHAQDAGFVSDFRVGTAVVNMYVKGGSMEDARHVFDELGKRDVSAFNAIIGGYAKNGNGEKAFEVFHIMQQEGMKPNRITYLSILEACSGREGLALGKGIHAQCIKAGVFHDIRVATALIRMYTNCGSMKDAREVFDKMVIRDVVSWTVMVEGYAKSGHMEDAFGVFAMMQEEGIQPDKVTYMHILNACANVKYGRRFIPK